MGEAIIPAVLSIVSILISIFLLLKYLDLHKKFTHLTKGVSEKDIVELVRTFSTQQESLSTDIDLMNKEFSKIRKDTERFFRKVGLVRYQGFKDTGGDQSFSIALLDQTDSGFIITNLYGRGFSKTYAKLIEGGKSSHPLTDEEKEALVQAQKS